MQTKVSIKGQVVLPGPVRRKLGIRAGDPLEVDVEHGRIVFTPGKSRPHPVRIIDDPVTGRTLLLRLKKAAGLSLTFLEDGLDISHLPTWVKSAKQTTDGHLLALAKAHSGAGYARPESSRSFSHPLERPASV